MTDFSVGAELDISIPPGQLRAARESIESELGAIEIGTTNPSAMSAQMSRGRSRGGAGAGRTLRRLNEDRNELLGDTAVYLESIDDSLSEGVLGGGGGGLAAEILGIGGDFAAEGAGVAAETATGLATDVAGSAIGQAAGSVIANQISGSTVGVDDTPVPVTPNPLPVSGDGGSGGTTLSPTINTSTTLSPTLSPDFSPEFTPDLDVDLPDLKFGGGGSGSNIQTPHPVVVENLDSFEPVSISTPGDNITGRAPPNSTSPPSPPTRNRGAFQRAGDALDDIGAGAVDLLPFVDAPPSVSEPLSEEGTPTGRPAETLGKAIDTVNPATSGGFGSGGSSTTVENNVDADVSPRITIEVDTDRLERDVGREFDRAIDDVRRELMDKINELERELDDLRRGITQRR